MPNEYSFQTKVKDTDFILENKMLFYRKVMSEYDLNARAIYVFVKAIQKGDLDAIKNMFNVLTPLQKRGMISELMVDGNDIVPGGISTITPFGKAIEVSMKYGHTNIVNYLSENIQDNYTIGATAGALQGGKHSNTSPIELGKYIGSFLSRKKRPCIAVNKAAHEEGLKSEKTGITPPIFR